MYKSSTYYIPVSLIILCLFVIIALYIVIKSHINSTRYKKIYIQRPKTYSCSTRQLYPTSKIYPLKDVRYILSQSKKEIPNIGEYRAYNPSICKIDDLIVMYYRLSNFTYENGVVSTAEKMMHKGHGEYVMSYAVLQLIPINTFNNGLDDLVDAIQASNNVYLIDMPPSLPEQYPYARVPCGYEDLRLFYSNKYRRLYGLMNSHTVTNYNRMFICSLGSIEDNQLKIDVANTKMIKSSLTKEKCFEKNFPPFLYNNELYLSHTLFPHIILKYPENPVGDIVTCNVVYNTGAELMPLRGGTQSIHLAKEKLYIGCGHIRDGLRYFHHFYAFDDTPPFSMKYISTRFTISDDLYGENIVQVATGIELIGDNLLITYGEEDSRPYLLVIPISEVISSLLPLSNHMIVGS